ncbi:ABC-type polysaccharide/polyol phosphate export system, permease component [Polaromonas sp. CF318]|uniref:ABC transporter permease n=1 Tax=Polaromonas sp. CF318 TaxID=1144318 RepID=UPI000270E276|nr:ABC transporter permease [Polaromonas sp. CF318]EJL91687.1 ABC-type polysaccharide/polyol phosphate export system, permease component [Polaromonas sp. CF318]
MHKDHTTVLITSRKGWGFPDIGELWGFRELIWILVTRDIKIRYKQTAIGVLWAILQPLLTMVVFTVIFGKLGGLPSDNLPYPVFVMTALLPWQLFSKALTQGSTSMVTMGGMMGKIYFPRLIAPLSSILSGLVDFAISFGILIALMLWYGVYPGWEVVLAPVFILLALASAMAVALWLSAINAKYRDVQQAMPFLTQIWMFVTPVIYPTSMIPENWKWLFMLNPMVSVIDGFRWSLLGVKPPDMPSLIVSSLSIVVLAIGGLVYFARFEKDFVDRL